jgi:hypothetical protein
VQELEQELDLVEVPLQPQHLLQQVELVHGVV